MCLFRNYLRPILIYRPETRDLAKTDINRLTASKMTLLESTGGNTTRKMPKDENS
jgi:hypothetical protein